VHPSDHPALGDHDVVDERIAHDARDRDGRDDRDDKYHAKNVIDTIIYRFGDMVASWTHKGLLALAAGSTALVLAAVPLTVGWIALAIGLGVGFRRRTKDEPPRADRA
jgi:1,4-dihydroxy-2-naphthoate octaprenyltransferase